MFSGVSIIIPTYNGGSLFHRCLEKIKSQDYVGEIQLVVIDSGSTDGTPEIAENSGAVVKRIKQENFNHSRTRNEALALAVHDKVVFMVQDAIPVANNWFTSLVSSLEQEQIAAAYVQQVPHDDADIYARYEVESHNEYLGKEPVVQSINSAEAFAKLSYDEALRLVRFDNVCAIYRKHLLEKNPFPDIEFAEDMAWAHSMILQGYKILFQPQIVVSHSHNRTPEYRFRRAIADSRACAQILGVVRDDLSCFNSKDLRALHKSIQAYAESFQNESSAGEETRDNTNTFIQTLTKMVWCIPVSRKNMVSILNRLAPARIKKKVMYEAVEQALKQHISFTISMLIKRYQLTSKHEILKCIKQISSSTVGRIYGEVYASYLLKGNVPDEIEGLVRPYMDGV